MQQGVTRALGQLVLVLVLDACATPGVTVHRDEPEPLDALAARWRASAAPADLVRAAERIAPGTDPARVRDLLGEPLVVSQLSAGGESWLYVKSDPDRGQFEALFVVFDPAMGFVRIDRKPIE